MQREAENLPLSNVKVENECAQIVLLFRAAILEYEKLRRFEFISILIRNSR
jgi:hypothetical protein